MASVLSQKTRLDINNLRISYFYTKRNKSGFLNKNEKLLDTYVYSVKIILKKYSC